MDIPGVGGDETKPKNYYQRRGIILLIFLVVFAGLKWGAGMLQGPGWNYMAMFISAMIIVTDSMANEARYTTREKIVTDNRTFSYNPRSVFEVGEWLVIEVGGMNVSFWPAISGGEGTIVVPKELVRKENENIRVYGRPHHVSKKELPPSVRKIVDSNDLGEPYRFTIIPTTLPIDFEEDIDKDIEKLNENVEKKLEALNQQISNLDDYLGGDLDRIKELHDVGKSMTDQGPSIKDRILGRSEEE